MQGRIAAQIELARPSHWIKNVIVLFPLVFAVRMGSLSAWGKAWQAVLAFCLASSAVYVFNDIKDRERDRRHPRKKDRPLASGRMSVGQAICEGIVLLVAALAVALLLSPVVFGAVLAYLLLQFAYTFMLKQKILVDVMCIALGFVLRTAAGALAISVSISPWLFICVLTLCLFMGFCKRGNEVATMGDTDQAVVHRDTLQGYTSSLLTHLITLSAGLAIVSFLLYASSQRTVKHFGTDYLIYTSPLVIYGIARFAMLSMTGKYADPTEFILRDWPMQLTIVLWFTAVITIILHGRELQYWLRSVLTTCQVQTPSCAALAKVMRLCLG